MAMSINYCLYEYRLLSLAHDCFYDFSPTPITKLFMKYDTQEWKGKGKELYLSV